jgi:hypothetical protein
MQNSLIERNEIEYAMERAGLKPESIKYYEERRSYAAGFYFLASHQEMAKFFAFLGIAAGYAEGRGEDTRQFNSNVVKEFCEGVVLEYAGSVTNYIVFPGWTLT